MRTVFGKKMNLQMRVLLQSFLYHMSGRAAIVVHNHQDGLHRIDHEQMLKRGKKSSFIRCFRT